MSTLALALHGTVAHADCSAVAPWDRIPRSLDNFATPVPLALTTGAVLAPVAMIPSGLDHRLRLVAQDELGGKHNLEPVSIAAPYVMVGGVLVGYVVSTALGHCDSQRVQAALLQSVALTGGTVLLLKWATGRQWPQADRNEADPASLRADTSTRFEPFGDPYRAFPSGHTAIMFAAAAALRTTLPEDAWYRWLGYPLGIGVAAGMWLGDHHWASDVVAGGLLGEAIGGSVGRSFSNEEQAALSLLPVPGGASVQWSGSW
ncbi:MAG TPA: phosphatase PAP2 family protein [Polyangiaceae bacterium]|nr:phosphatase PAP2 family protein [Polyangiaceae bacterium]